MAVTAVKKTARGPQFFNAVTYKDKKIITNVNASVKKIIISINSVAKKHKIF